MKYEDVKYDYYEKTADVVSETHEQDTGSTTIIPSVEQIDDSQRVFSDFIATDISAIDNKANKIISTKSDYVGSNNASIKLATTTQEHGEMFVAPGAESFGTGAAAITINPVTSIGVSSKTFKDKESKQNNVENWLLQRQAQVSEFRNVIITFTVPGNTSRHVGDLIEFAVPSHIPEDDSEVGSVQIGHQLYSGYYLISKIRHIIKKSGFEMDLELIKNSFAKRIPGQEGVGKDSEAELKKSGRIKGQSGR
jgi:hypothetical protein